MLGLEAGDTEAHSTRLHSDWAVAPGQAQNLAADFEQKKQMMEIWRTFSSDARTRVHEGVYTCLCVLVRTSMWVTHVVPGVCPAVHVCVGDTLHFSINYQST